MITIKTDELDSSGEVHVMGCILELEEQAYVMIQGAEASFIQIKREHEGFVIDVFSSDESTEAAQTMTVWDSDYEVEDEL